MSQARAVTATFGGSGGGGGGAGGTPTSHTLTASRAGTGGGTVTSSPAGINCGTDCTEAYGSGTTVTLTATAAKTSRFAGWSGACTGTALICTVTMSAARSVTAAFTVRRRSAQHRLVPQPPGASTG